MMQVYKISEVAKRLAVHHLTIRTMIKKGQIKVVRVNEHTMRIPQSELDRLLEVK